MMIIGARGGAAKFMSCKKKLTGKFNRGSNTVRTRNRHTRPFRKKTIDKCHLVASMNFRHFTFF
jgi:hypothetical protein